MLIQEELQIHDYCWYKAVFVSSLYENILHLVLCRLLNWWGDSQNRRLTESETRRIGNSLQDQEGERTLSQIWPAITYIHDNSVYKVRIVFMGLRELFALYIRHHHQHLNDQAIYQTFTSFTTLYLHIHLQSTVFSS